MIYDLMSVDQDRHETADICIVGAGIAGLILATRLRQHGKSVIVLESGGRTYQGLADPLNTVVANGGPYHGATKGRARGLGGTSMLWGGALIPFLHEDMEARPYLDLPAWPVRMHDIEPHLCAISELFGVDGGPEDAMLLRLPYGLAATGGDRDFLPRFARWPSFARRNVASLLMAEIETDQSLSIWLNATVTDVQADRANGRISAIEAQTKSNRRIRVSAAAYVVAGGAIETTRLLSAFDRRNDGRPFAGCTALGRYFHDHVSLPAAHIEPHSISALNRLAGFRFVGPTMRNLRLELSPDAQRREGVPSAFGHIAFQGLRSSGFDALRDLMRQIQQGGQIGWRHMKTLLADLPYLARAAYWRMGHKQLLWPSPATYELHVVAEQLPRAENRIGLSSELDPFGVPRAEIAWSTGESERETARTYARLFSAYWKRHGLDRLGDLRWSPLLDGATTSDYQSFGDIYHPGGTTRMGTDGTHAVVDDQARIWAIPNMWLASTSIFPSGASANPTLMLMAFARRLADHLGGMRLPA